MNVPSLHLASDEIRLDFIMGMDGAYRLTDLRTGEVYEASDLGVVRAWDRTEDRLRVELLIPEPEKRKAIVVERLSDTCAVLHVDIGGRGSRSPEPPVMLGIQFDVQIELSANTVQITIPERSLKENLPERYALFSIELLCNLGATPRGSRGYLLIPSWCGAVYYFDRSHPRASQALARPDAFGPDSEEGIRRRWGHPSDAPAEHGSLVYGHQGAWEDQLELGVYATVRNGSALAGILIGGAWDTELLAKRDQGPDHRACVYPRFHYRYFWHSKRDTESRRFRLVFLRGKQASYSGVANLYRQFLLDECGVQPLRIRAARNQAVRYFIESIYLRFLFGMTHEGKPRCYQSFADVADVLGLFKQVGFAKASIIATGANVGGHDWAHPTIFPFEPAFGGEAGFRALVRTAREHGYTIGLHTNYKDVYRHSPDWNEEAIQRNFWGDLRYHGAWVGGWSYQGIPHKMLELYLKRDFPKLKALGLSGFWYFDAVGAVLEESFAPGERMCRREYAQGMNAWFRYANEVFGCCGNELSIAPSIGLLVHTNVHYPGDGEPTIQEGNGYSRCGLIDRFVPLQHMVYHGLCLYNGHAETAGRIGAEFWKKPTREQIARLYRQWRESERWRGDLEYEYFIEHEEIAPGVTRSVFSDGSEIYVNKTDRPWRRDGLSLPAEGCLVLRPQGG